MAAIPPLQRVDLGLAVVIGAGGMGMAVARRLGHSYRLLVVDISSQALEARADELRSEGHDVTTFCGDITQAADVKRLAAAAKQAGPVTALAHVAGLSPSADDFDLIMRVNLVGTRLVEQHFAAILEPGSCGLFISSTAAHMQPVPDALAPILDDPLKPTFIDELHEALGEGADPSAAYVLSKTALNARCRRISGEWGRRGLRIVTLSPGLIATPMGALSYETSPMKRALFDAIPLSREGSVIEIATVVEFLLSRGASYVSGTDIRVDGGLIGATQG